jgi:hypothetical protein
MFALLYRRAEVFHMIQFSHITNRWLPLYLGNDDDPIDTKILQQYLTTHVNEMWKKYL